MSRNVKLEIDKISGTQLPPSNVIFENHEFDLKSIFLNAGLNLNIKTNETDLPDLSGPDGAYSLGELDNLMQKHRNTEIIENDMNAYLVVVNGVYFNEEPERYGPDHDVLGIMFDLSKRLGTAVFYGNDMINSDPYAFLRTSAHELGHQFNLQHTDAGSYFKDGHRRFTIMNQTRIITRHKSFDPIYEDEYLYPGWPMAIGFNFGDYEKVHLNAHPFLNVTPGGSTFTDCDSIHDSWRNTWEERIQ